MRKFLLLIVPIIIIAIGYTVWKQPDKNTQTQQSDATNHQQPKAPTKPNKIRLLATGDFIAHDSVNSAAQKSDGTYDYLPLIKDFTDIFKGADIRFCNDPILNGGKAFGITGYPNFNSPTEFVTDMGRLGCNLINTASNHSFDFSQANITATQDAWSKVANTLAVVGQNRSQAEHDKVQVFEVQDVKFAFLAYTSYSNKPPQNSYGVNIYSNQFASQQIAQARSLGAEFIIVSMRWGTEYSTSVNNLQKTQAQFLADQGVNLVLGHGPHVLQPVQELAGSDGSKTVVWYSLGNFLNTQIPAETQFNGLGIIDIDIATKKISTMRYLPIYMHYEWTGEQAQAEQLGARNNLHLYLLEQATDQQIAKHQLSTTINAQKDRMSKTLNLLGQQIPLITSKEL